MTEQEKNDREQLEYLKRWQEKKKQKCKKTNVFRRILQREKIVEVIAISQDTEAPGHYQVVYKCDDGSVWSRPYGMFVSKVDKEKYPDAKQEYRFE